MRTKASNNLKANTGEGTKHRTKLDIVLFLVSAPNHTASLYEIGKFYRRKCGLRCSEGAYRHVWDLEKAKIVASDGKRVPTYHLTEEWPKNLLLFVFGHEAGYTPETFKTYCSLTLDKQSISGPLPNFNNPWKHRAADARVIEQINNYFLPKLSDIGKEEEEKFKARYNYYLIDLKKSNLESAKDFTKMYFLVYSELVKCLGVYERCNEKCDEDFIEFMCKAYVFLLSMEEKYEVHFKKAETEKDHFLRFRNEAHAFLDNHPLLSKTKLKWDREKIIRATKDQNIPDKRIRSRKELRRKYWVP